MGKKKIIFSILGAIILGAIGSGVWAKLLSPAWDWTVDKTIRFFSSVFGFFKDSIYQEAAQGFHEKYSLEIYMLLLMLIAGFYTGVLMIRYFEKFEKPRERMRLVFRSKKEFLVFNVIVLSSLISIILTGIQSNYINKITTKSLNSIEIIAPFIEQKAYFDLKSEFLRIENGSDYRNFYERMVKLSKENKINLALFKPL